MKYDTMGVVSAKGGLFRVGSYSTWPCDTNPSVQWHGPSRDSWVRTRRRRRVRERERTRVPARQFPGASARSPSQFKHCEGGQSPVGWLNRVALEGLDIATDRTDHVRAARWVDPPFDDVVPGRTLAVEEHPVVTVVLQDDIRCLVCQDDPVTEVTLAVHVLGFDTRRENTIPPCGLGEAVAPTATDSWPFGHREGDCPQSGTATSIRTQ